MKKQNVSYLEMHFRRVMIVHRMDYSFVVLAFVYILTCNLKSSFQSHLFIFNTYQRIFFPSMTHVLLGLGLYLHEREREKTIF